MSEELLLQRDSGEIYATLYGKSTRGVLLCPPHPKYGGSREDSRLVAIANELANSGISSVCFDYSAYTGGIEEVKDTLFVLDYMGKTMTSLGLLGYSFGAVVASKAAARFSNLQGLVLISPLMTIDDLRVDLTSTCKKLIIYGLHDDFVIKDINELFDSAKGEKQRLSLDTDHFYGGYEGALAHAVREFFVAQFPDFKSSL